MNLKICIEMQLTLFFILDQLPDPGLLSDPSQFFGVKVLAARY